MIQRMALEAEIKESGGMVDHFLISPPVMKDNNEKRALL